MALFALDTDLRNDYNYLNVRSMSPPISAPLLWPRNNQPRRNLPSRLTVSYVHETRKNRMRSPCSRTLKGEKGAREIPERRRGLESFPWLDQARSSTQKRPIEPEYVIHGLSYRNTDCKVLRICPGNPLNPA